MTEGAWQNFGRRGRRGNGRATTWSQDWHCKQCGCDNRCNRSSCRSCGCKRLQPPGGPGRQNWRGLEREWDSRQQPESSARPREANPARTAVKLTPCTREEQAARLERVVTARKALEGLPQLAWTCRDLMFEEESLRQGLAADQRSLGVRLGTMPSPL